MLAFESAGAIVQSGASVWPVTGFVGGCAAIAIGLGTLLEWETLEREPTGSNRSLAVLGLAAVAFFVGAGIAVA
ncbi:hypothetical protein C489_19991 [Natrinema versiforme JCM 10478]|uniref:Uncharacterized protein n=1 Tax=Natrinema versiforme JCM 10478 TaxID=1227496 RepID=L9XNK5_9EURY|nr:hypothetical protein C489_19991 [Natrinema versiforme JCM 10478]